MCNLYSMTTNVEAIRRFFQVDASRDRAGNQPSVTGIYPDYPAPIEPGAATAARVHPRVPAGWRLAGDTVWLDGRNSVRTRRLHRAEFVHGSFPVVHR